MCAASVGRRVHDKPDVGNIRRKAVPMCCVSGFTSICQQHMGLLLLSTWDACWQANAVLQKRAEDDEQLLSATETMLQQLQTSLATARQEAAAHQDALASSHLQVDSLKRKLDAAEQDMQRRQSIGLQALQQLQTQVQSLEQQLEQARARLSESQTSLDAKQSHLLDLELSIAGEHICWHALVYMPLLLVQALQATGQFCLTCSSVPPGLREDALRLKQNSSLQKLEAEQLQAALSSANNASQQSKDALQASQTVLDCCKSKLALLDSQKADLTQQMELKSVDYEALKGAMAKMQQHLDDTTGDLNAARLQAQASAVQFCEFSSSLADVNVRMEALQMQLAAKAEACTELNLEKDALTRQLADLQQEVQQKEVQLDDAQAGYVSLQRRTAMQEALCQQQQADGKATGHRAALLEQQVNFMTSRIDALQQQAAEAQSQADSYRRQLQEAESAARLAAEHADAAADVHSREMTGLQASMATLREQLLRSSAACRANLGAASESEGRVQRLEALQAILDQRLAEQSEAMASEAAQRVTAEEALAVLKLEHIQTISAHEEAMSSYRKSLQAQRDALSEKQSQMDASTARLAAALQHADEQSGLATERGLKLQQQLDLASDKIVVAQTAQAQAQEDASNLNIKNLEQQRRIQQLDDAMKAEQEENRALSDRLATVRKDSETASTQHAEHIRQTAEVQEQQRTQAAADLAALLAQLATSQKLQASLQEQLTESTSQQRASQQFLHDLQSRLDESINQETDAQALLKDREQQLAAALEENLLLQQESTEQLAEAASERASSERIQEELSQQLQQATHADAESQLLLQDMQEQLTNAANENNESQQKQQAEAAAVHAESQWLQQDLQRQLAELIHAMQHSQQKQQELKADLAAAADEQGRLEKTISEQHATIKHLEASDANHSQTSQQLQSAHDGQLQQGRELEEQVTSLQEQLAAAEVKQLSTMNALNAATSKLQQHQQDAQSQLQGLESREASLGMQLQHVQVELDGEKIRSSSLSEELNDLRRSEAAAAIQHADIVHCRQLQHAEQEQMQAVLTQQLFDLEVKQLQEAPDVVIDHKASLCLELQHVHSELDEVRRNEASAAVQHANTIRRSQIQATEQEQMHAVLIQQLVDASVAAKQHQEALDDLHNQKATLCMQLEQTQLELGERIAQSSRYFEELDDLRSHAAAVAVQHAQTIHQHQVQRYEQEQMHAVLTQQLVAASLDVKQLHAALAAVNENVVGLKEACDGHRETIVKDASQQSASHMRNQQLETQLFEAQHSHDAAAAAHESELRQIEGALSSADAEHITKLELMQSEHASQVLILQEAVQASGIAGTQQVTALQQMNSMLSGLTQAEHHHNEILTDQLKLATSRLDVMTETCQVQKASLEAACWQRQRACEQMEEATHAASQDSKALQSHGKLLMFMLHLTDAGQTQQELLRQQLSAASERADTADWIIDNLEQNLQTSQQMRQDQLSEHHNCLQQQEARNELLCKQLALLRDSQEAHALGSSAEVHNAYSNAQASVKAEHHAKDRQQLAGLESLLEASRHDFEAAQCKGLTQDKLIAMLLRLQMVQESQSELLLAQLLQSRLEAQQPQLKESSESQALLQGHSSPVNPASRTTGSYSSTKFHAASKIGSSWQSDATPAHVPEHTLTAIHAAMRLATENLDLCWLLVAAEDPSTYADPPALVTNPDNLIAALTEAVRLNVQLTRLHAQLSSAQGFPTQIQGKLGK